MNVRLTALVCLAVLGVCAVSWGQAVQIDSTGSADRRPFVAIPDFAAGPGMEAAAKEMSQVAAYDLDFTGLVQIVRSDSYPPAFQGFTPDPTQIDFVAWRTVKPMPRSCNPQSVSLQCKECLESSSSTIRACQTPFSK